MLNIIGNATGVGNQFTPLSISGLKLWLAADRGTFQGDDLTTAASEDGDVVGSWQDLSGQGNHVSEATNKPTLKVNIQNGKPVVRGDGTNDILTAAGLGTGWGSSVGSLFVVYRPNGDATHGLLRFSSASNTYWRFSDGNGYFGPFRSARIEQTPTGQPTTGAAIISVISGASDYTIKRNGSSVGNAAASWGVSADLTLFYESGSGGGFGSVDIAEVLLYNTALTAAQENVITEYLNRKWAVY